jgi:hypothetical protein
MNPAAASVSSAPVMMAKRSYRRRLVEQLNQGQGFLRKIGFLFGLIVLLLQDAQGFNTSPFLRIRNRVATSMTFKPQTFPRFLRNPKTAKANENKSEKREGADMGKEQKEGTFEPMQNQKRKERPASIVIWYPTTSLGIARMTTA